MRSKIYFLLFLIVFSFEAAPALSQMVKPKIFKTDYVSFQLSDQWGCAMDGSEYVCRPVSSEKRGDAIIIIAAKLPGKDDNVKAYYTYLQQPKKITDFKGQMFSSKVSFIKYKDIVGTQWVDAVHLSSELKNFYTRYLATVKNSIAILVTYSVARSRHNLYAAELNKMIASMQVIAKPPQIAAPPKTAEKEVKKQPAGK